jgi:hypothetical protein
LTLAYKLRSLGHLRNAAVARRFVEDMRAFFAETNRIKADEIAARQLHALRQHYNGKLRLTDVKEMFLQMRDQS